MKTWTELTSAEQQAVRKHEQLRAVRVVLKADPTLFWEENHPAVRRFDQLAEEMERMQTPWFLGESLYHDKTFRVWIDEYVDGWLTDNNVYFLEPSEVSVYIPHMEEQHK